MRRELTFLASFLLLLGTAAHVCAQLPPGWSSGDIGGPSAAGSARYEEATQTWTIQADGTGLRESADQFHYVYKPLVGDGELVMRVVSIEPAVDEWAMAGVMLRVFLDPASPYLIMAVTPNGPNLDHGVTYYGRATPGGVTDHESSGAMTPPYWVKISRTGNTFAGFHSPDGVTWTEQWSDDVDGVPPNIYIGMAVTSDVGGTLVTAVFDSGPTKAYNPSPADGAMHVAAPLLEWTPGATAAFHDVYCGTDPALGPDQYRGRLPATQPMYFHPGTVPGTTYYWRIDEVNMDRTTVHTGDVWSFTSVPAVAYAPDPWDGGKGVNVEADLMWASGVNAITHDVYFGTDRVAVAAADPGTFKTSQVLCTCDPGTLSENTTYYWKIDEHMSDGTMHEGAVWTFRTFGPGDGVKAEYFKGMGVSGAPVLTQVEDSIDHAWGDGEVAAGISDAISARWTAGLEVPFTETYQLITSTDDGARLWLDGRLLINDWTDHGTTDNVAEVHLVAGHVYSLTMEWYDNGGGAVARLSWQSPSIPRQTVPAGVLQLPLWAACARPTHVAVDVAQSPTLRWRAGDEATGHDVYFGEDAEAVADATPATAGIYRGRQAVDLASYAPGPLEWNKTYYWRVDEVSDANPDSPWKGNVWSFTTADCVVVDDFEDYTDELGERIFQTWIDGFGYTEPVVVAGNGTGATVGYTEAPFAEQTIVRSGWQSMPLEYDNATAPYYSETSRTWTTPQDWTVNDVETLTLYFRGRPGNEPDTLYVVLEDSAGKIATASHPNPDAVLTTTWTEWSIPPADLADVNAASVKKMYIGLGDRDHPMPGGAGLLYIDDVRVIRQEAEATD